MATVRDLLEFIAANPVSPDSEVHVIRNDAGNDPNGIDVEAIAVAGFRLTAEGCLRVDTY